MSDVVALAMPGGPDFVTALRACWDEGAVVAPVDPRLPAAARDAVLDTLAPAVVVDESGTRHRRPGGRPAEPGDALVMATSGTSGRPKGVVLTHGALEASARATSARLAVDPDRDHWLACLPPAHVGGLAVVTRALLTGTRLTAQPGFDPVEVERAGRGGVTLVALVPTALGRLDPSVFRTVLVGGAAPPADPPGNAVITYGSTETGSGVVYDGVPLDGVEVALAPDGAIRVRGPMLLRAYRDGTDPRDPDGWLATGDLGRWDGGRLLVEGRRDDLIVTGGENVWPDPVERALVDHPAVSEVAVTGRDDPEWGQRVVAHVVPADPAAPPTLDHLREAVKRRLPAWAAPRELVLHRALPRTRSGKLRRADLR